MQNFKARTILRGFTALALVCASTAAVSAPPAGYCEVTLCSKLEAPKVQEWNLPDSQVGETCSPAVLSKSDAVRNKKVNSNASWFTASSTPTRVPVTRVKNVGQCTSFLAPPTPKART